jgi:hypothetical protein
MKTYEAECSASHPGRFTVDQISPSTHWMGGWVDPRDSKDAMDKRKIMIVPGIEPQPSSA